MKKFNRLLWLSFLTVSQVSAFLLAVQQAHENVAWWIAIFVFGATFAGVFITLCNEVVTDDPANKSAKKKEADSGKK